MKSIKFVFLTSALLLSVNTAFAAEGTPAPTPAQPAKPAPTATQSTNAPTTNKRQGPSSKRAKMWDDYLALLSFEVSGMYVDQGSGQNTSTAMVAWTPAYWFNEEFAVGANIGTSTIVTSDATNSKIGASLYDYELFGRYAMRGIWDVEIAAGSQTWGRGGGTASVATVQFGYDPAVHILDYIDRIFISYSRFNQSTKAANEYRLGIGMLF